MKRFVIVIVIHVLRIYCKVQVLEDDSYCRCDEDVVNLPTYTKSQIVTHYKKSTEMWASYRAGVYNLTDFVDKHPGGKDIFAVGGGHVEPFWNALPVHKHARIYRLLESFRIGNLAIDDRKEEKIFDFDPFALEQNGRPNAMEVLTSRPYNAHAYPADLAKSFITHADLHYVRLHLVVPHIEWNEHRVKMEGFGENGSIVLTMNDIKNKFPKHFLNVTLQCSGNRRSEMNKILMTHGVAYKQTAISTATWGGVFLTDLLNHFQLLNGKSNNMDKYLDFVGADQDPAGIMNFGSSIPADIALNPSADFLLAYEMNGKLLHPDHGFPIRLIAPGMAGFKSVKFLSRIILSKEIVDNVWEQRMYRFYNQKYYWHNIDYNSAPSLLYTNVQSAILIPQNEKRVKIGKDRMLWVKGYAFSGGGTGIRRIDVTIDGGKKWKEAEIVEKELKRTTWAWVFWEIKIKMKKKRKTVSISCRAFDNNYNSQPKDIHTIWNMMGVLVNSWHNVNVTLKYTK